MSSDKRDILLEKFNGKRVSGNKNTTDDLDRLDNIHRCLSHTWQAKNSSGCSCFQSYECDCDDLKLTNATVPSSFKTNVSLRAVAHYCFDDSNPYEYEIIDIQASPHTGHIMHPPDPCVTHNKHSQQSR